MIQPAEPTCHGPDKEEPFPHEVKLSKVKRISLQPDRVKEGIYKVFFPGLLRDFTGKTNGQCSKS